MPYQVTRRVYGNLGKRVCRYFNYKRAKRLCSEISRDIDIFENRFLKSRVNHA